MTELWVSQSHDDSVVDEACSIVQVLANVIPQQLDGRKAIREMRESGSRMWRQSEWIGFYLDEIGRKRLYESLGGTSGPVFGNSGFDYERHYVWDFKAHSTVGASKRVNHWAPLNDVEAVDNCIHQNGGVGFIIMHGRPEFDSTGAFRAWHEELKGGPSAYTVARMARSASARPRKVSFAVEQFQAVFLKSADDVLRAQNEGWLRFFQDRFRNSGGSPRRAKYMMNLHSIRDWAVAATALL